MGNTAPRVLPPLKDAIVDKDGKPTQVFVDFMQVVAKRLNDPGISQMYIENGDLMWNDATQTPHVIVAA